MVVDPSTRILLHPHPPPSPAASLEKEPLVSNILTLRILPSFLSHPRLTSPSGHALRRNAAGAFGPDLAKKLSQLVKMEKNVMRSLEQVAKERMEVAVRPPRLRNPESTAHNAQQQLSLWGEACDEDVSDVTDKLGVLLYEIGELEDQYVDRYDQYRVTMKSIRNIEASVQPSRDSRPPSPPSPAACHTVELTRG